MSYQKQQFGIMDQGYFVPKSQILAWINYLLQINITKIEALGSGSIYCQIFDVIHPGKINLAKINWKAKNDTQFLTNFRLLQTAMQKTGIKRHIQVEKLVKAKYQDNLQFIQWLKRYFDTNCGNKGQGYDAAEKRNKIVPDFGFCQKTVVPKVYNATGLVVHRQKITSPNAKKEEIQPRLKSPRVVKTPVVNNRKAPVVAPKKQQHPKVQTKKPQPVKKQPTVTTNAIKKPTTSQHVQAPKLQKLESHKKPQAQTEVLNKKIKDLNQKIDMIKQIVISQDVSDMKINLIKQLLNISTQKETSQKTQPIPLKKEEPKQQFLQTNHEQQHEVLVAEYLSNDQDLLSHEQLQPENIHAEEIPISLTPAESNQQDHLTETHQEQIQLQEKPDFSQVAQSQHDDDII